MGEKKKFLKIKPATQGGWMTIPFKGDELWQWINEFSVGEEWEIQVIEMTQEEYDKLPEFEGW